MRITMDYVDTRNKQFAAKYQACLLALNYPATYVAERVAVLAARLASRDYKMYGDRPVNFLHAGKRITRFAIRSAIEHCPQQKQRRERLREEYDGKIAEERRRNPTATFFSFEAAYAEKLEVPMGPHRQWFCI